MAHAQLLSTTTHLGQQQGRFIMTRVCMSDFTAKILFPQNWRLSTGSSLPRGGETPSPVDRELPPPRRRDPRSTGRRVRQVLVPPPTPKDETQPRRPRALFCGREVTLRCSIILQVPTSPRSGQSAVDSHTPSGGQTPPPCRRLSY